MTSTPPPRLVLERIQEPAERREARLPAFPVDYQHLMRGRAHTWWKPLLALLVMVAFFVVLQVAMVVALIPMAIVDPQNPFVVALAAMDFTDPGVMLMSLLTLAVLIPFAMWSVRIGFGVRAGYLSSVAGRFRWGWTARVVAVVLPLWAVYLGVMTWVSGGLHVDPADGWPWLVAMVVLLVPLQAAGEEYAFRGFVLQTIGAWIPHRVLALVVPGVVSVVLFALAHGSLDPVILLDLAAFAALAVYLTWRTGGLEAAVVVHAVNNVLLFLLDTVEGDVSQSLIGEDSTQEWIMLVPSLALNLTAAVAITLLARRAKPQRSHEPRPLPPEALVPVTPWAWAPQATGRVFPATGARNAPGAPTVTGASRPGPAGSPEPSGGGPVRHQDERSPLSDDRRRP